ncbi:MAG: DNA repair exonuclease [Nanoarchaeota archaeon]
MKFAHMGDCHLGGWKLPELSELNFKSFKMAIEKCIREKVDFVLITGDLFDSPYPSIEILGDSFMEFKKLRDSGIPVFLIAGSHDYSASGKTFLEVLEKSGFCCNVSISEERNNSIILLPTLFKNIAIYGYSGKKSGLEVEDIERIKIQDSPGLFKILMLHTALRDAVGSLPIKAVDHTKLPKVDYLALSHLHIVYNREGRVYSGPIFPNTLSELEELKSGFFYIFENGKAKREEIKIKPVISLSIELKNAFNATEQIISVLDQQKLNECILILKIYGILEQGKISDIDFLKIESYARKKGAYSFLKNTTKLNTAESKIEFDYLDTYNIEQQIIKNFEESNPSRFNKYIPQLLNSLQIEKKEEERSLVFEERVLNEAKKVLNI